MSIFSWFWHVIIPSTHVIKLPHLQGRPVPPHRRPRRRRASSHITFTFTSILAAQIARLAGSLRRNNRVSGRVLVGGRLHCAARAATWPAGRADGSWSAPGECQAFIHGVHCLQDTTAVQSPRRGEIFCKRGGIMAKITSRGSPSRGKRCSGTALLQGSVCTRFGAAWTRP